MEKYKQLVQELYTEPKDEEIIGSFLETVEAEATTDRVNKEKPKKKTDVNVKPKDIRAFLMAVRTHGE